MPLIPGALIEYHPYWERDELGKKCRNMSFTKDSAFILDLKGDNQVKAATAARYFATEALQYIKAHYGVGTIDIFTIVPGHKADSLSKPLTDIIRVLAARTGATPMPGLLRRKSDIEKLAHGGNRSLPTHLTSIAVTNPIEIVGKTVLVLDDVMTSGNSLAACEFLLRQANVRNVITLALAKTVR